MKATILDGLQLNDGASERLHDLVVREMKNLRWEVRSLPLRQMKILPCRGCFDCWVKTPGSCTVKDDAAKVARAVIQSDLVVHFTPVTFGGYSSMLKKALDRNICLISPFFMKIGGETHHKPRYRHYPILVGIGLLQRHDAESERIFRNLIQRNALNLHAPEWAVGVLQLDRPPADNLNRIHAILRRLDGSK